MADDWQVGDLALCVDDKFNRALKSGMIYMVEAVVLANSPGAYDHGETGLRLVGVTLASLSGAANAKRFRKIPAHEADEFDRETIALLTGQRQPVEA